MQITQSVVLAHSPKISIAVPSLNTASFLKECLDSIKNQTLTSFEVLFVDAGSTDGTLEIFKKYAEKDARFKLIVSPRKSYGHQVNLALEEAEGEYVAIVEPDDFIEWTMYEKLTELADKHHLDFIKANYRKFWKTEKGYKSSLVRIIDSRLMGRVINPQVETQAVTFVTTWSGIYRREFLLRNKIQHNETPGAAYQDNGFYFQTHCCAEKVFFLDEPFYWYRQDNANSSINNNSKLEPVIEEYKFIYAFLKQHPERYQKFIKRYSRELYYAYMATYKRLAEEYKLLFLKKFSQELKELAKRDELFLSVWGETDRQKVIQIFRNPEKFYFEDRHFGFINSSSYKNTDEIGVKSSFKILVKACIRSVKRRSFPIKRRIEFTLEQLGINKFSDLARRRANGSLHKEIIVTLTSYPGRIGKVAQVLEPIFNQTLPPDMVVIWLAEQDFPKKERQLPQELLNLKKKGLKIRWCANLFSHKKYFYSARENKSSLLITIDDDLVYPLDLVEKLYKSYQKHPKAVSAMRVHKVLFSPAGFAPYCDWKLESDEKVDVESKELFATTGAGCLIPPEALPPEFLNEELVLDTCPLADDIFLKALQIKVGIGVVLVQPHLSLQTIEGSQEEALWRSNLTEGQNDVQLRRINKRLNLNITDWQDQEYKGTK